MPTPAQTVIPKYHNLTKFQKAVIEKQAFYRDNPAQYSKDWFDMELYDKQIEILESVKGNKWTVVKSIPGVGKTQTAAVAVLWFMSCFYRPVVVTTAPTYRQVVTLLWTRIQGLHAKAGMRGMPIGGAMLTTKFTTPDPECYAVGYVARKTDPESFLGQHSPSGNILIVADEAGGISHEIWVAMDKLMTNYGARFLGIGNPLQSSGDFYDSFRDPKFSKITISAWDCPNIKEKRIVIPGLTTYDWIEPKLNLPKDSPIYCSDVLAQFPTSDEHALIPLSWIELAEQRWEENQGLYEEDIANNRIRPIVQGCDPADTGSDYTAIVWRDKKRVLSLKKVQQSVMESAGYLKSVIDAGYQYDGHTLKIYKTAVDSIGIGTGIVGRLRELEIPVTGVNFGERTDYKDKFGNLEFLNLRALCWWRLREALDPDGDELLELPRDEDLRADLTIPKWERMSTGKIKIESKEEIRKRLGRSPDKGDALAITFAPGVIWSEDIPFVTIPKSGDYGQPGSIFAGDRRGKIFSDAMTPLGRR